MGDTCYKFATISWETFTALVDTRTEQKFNRMRRLVLVWNDDAKIVLVDVRLIEKRPSVSIERRERGTHRNQAC